MNRRGLCLRAFPAAWRRRYGEELLALLAVDGARPWSADLDLLRAGLRERVRRGRSTTLVRAAGLAGAACATVALVPSAIAPATSTPRRRPALLAAVTPLTAVPRRVRVVRAQPRRGRRLVRAIVIRSARISPSRVRAAPVPAPTLIVRART